MRNQWTIFISVFQGVEAKNILRTDIFRILRERQGLRIVLFVQDKAKEEYFRKQFVGANVYYEIPRPYKSSMLDNLFSFLKAALLRTRTMDLRRKEGFESSKGHKGYLRYYSLLVLNVLFATAFFRQVTRWLDWQLVRSDNFKEIFDKYKPDLVFLANLFSDVEIAILREAKKRGIKTIGLVNSWDKITSRCMIRLLPDKLIVHNNIIKREAIKHAEMPEGDIEVTGIPHYDIFVNARATPRTEFCRRFGLDPEKRFLVFCPLGKRYGDMDLEILDILLGFKNEKLLPEDVEILVRFPPNDTVDVDSFKTRGVLFYQPGIRFAVGNERRVEWDMDEADNQILLDTLFHCSLLICQASSLTIDAAVFDKPIINFKIKSERNILPPRDGNWLYELDHYQPVLYSGGVRLVATKNEFLEWINKYWADPKIDARGRKKIREEQCWKLDGQAGRRVADLILKIL